MSVIFPRELGERLQAEYALLSAVETGTAKGYTADVLSEMVPQVFTIELDPGVYVRARKILSRHRNVEVVFGQSQYVLNSVLPRLEGPTLWWLDAHWSGCGTAKLACECPLLQELRLIGRHRNCDVVLIDDARLFVNPPPPPHVASEWPRMEAIEAELAAWQWPVAVEVIDDVIVITPKG